MEDRFENKYLPKKNYYQFHSLINSNRLKKHHDKLTINNIYFDTLDNYFFYQHVDGVLDRIKIRLRWYDNSVFFKGKLFIEIKRKKNNISKKYKRVLLNKNFKDFAKENLSNYITNIFNSKFLNFKNLQYIKPRLFNSYERDYYLVNQDKLNRITYDTNLFFGEINTDFKIKNKYLSKMSVVEHKFVNNFHSYGKLFNNSLTKTNFSKYIYGVTNTYNKLPL